MEREGVAVLADSNPGAIQRVLPLENFSATVRESAMRSLPAFLAFFCLENAVRELIVARLFDRHGSNWWSACASSAVIKKVQDRKEKEDKHRWHMQRGASEIFYTDFGDLLSLIQNNYSEFEDLFPDFNWVSSRLTELENSRNIIAHSNVLDIREVDRIRIYLEDWIRQVG